MLHINDLTYRIQGRTIFDGATAGIPAGHKVGPQRRGQDHAAAADRRRAGAR
jgi:hypothetical protein